MTTFEFDKSVDDIEEPQLLEIGWYPVTVTKAPTIRPNAALKEMVPGENPDAKALAAACKKNEKAGFTLFVDTAVLSADDETGGRRLTIMLPYPSKADLDRRNRDGMKVYDEKMQRITELCRAAGSDVEGKSADLNPGQELQLYVKKRRKQNREELENFVDIFAGFKAIGEEAGAGLEGLELGDDETPF